ncbi:MAG: class I SAM-dependent methyltransferase [Planctomycetia bacterium]|nr:class I SAM-dependent methyltransferase [Planctomycetia bacterium]
MDIHDQSMYWDRVASWKEFSLPVDVIQLSKYISHDAKIVDYGCGYGRVTKQLLQAGYTHVAGYDTSQKMVERGAREKLPLCYIPTPDALPVEDGTVDCVMIVALLTCIPDFTDQKNLIALLRKKLKPGGFLYMVDFPIQTDSQRVSRYDSTYEGTPEYGIFSLPEGVTLRHHTREWLQKLLAEFICVEENTVSVKSMNRNPALALRLILKKA